MRFLGGNREPYCFGALMYTIKKIIQDGCMVGKEGPTFVLQVVILDFGPFGSSN